MPVGEQPQVVHEECKDGYWEMMFRSVEPGEWERNQVLNGRSLRHAESVKCDNGI